VIYTTDNGAETFTWPDGGTTPFRGEKNTNWEVSYRVPALARWPGLVRPRTEINAIVSAEDCKLWWRRRASPTSRISSCTATTQAARASRCTSTVTTSAACLPAQVPTSAEAVFMEQPAHGLEVWMKPLVPLRAPKLFNLRSDPFERAEHEAGEYDKWFIEHLFVLVPAQTIVAQHLAIFQEFPPRQKPGSFSIDQAMDLLMRQKSSN
jgi:arylsulfatase